MDPDSAIVTEFSVDVRLKSEQELRFRLPPNYNPISHPIELMVTSSSTSSSSLSSSTTATATAEWNGAPLGTGVRYRVSPAHVRISIFSWSGCTLKIFVSDPETFAKMEPYITSTGGVWYNSVMEIHSYLHEMRQHAMDFNTSSSEAGAANIINSNPVLGPCLVIGGGPSSGRHQLATSLANLCVRSGGGACTVVDLDSLHQSCGTSALTGSSVGVPLTIGATVWETTRILDDSSTAHSVTFSLACGRPFVPALAQHQQQQQSSANMEVASSSSLSFAYIGAVTKLLRVVRQRQEAQRNTRAGWSGTIIILPRIENASCVNGYANLIYRVCEIARADRALLLGQHGGTRSVLSRLHQEYASNHGTITIKNDGATYNFSRQLRGATLSVDVQCMSSSPSALVASDMARVRLQEMGVRYLLNGSATVPILQVIRHLPLSQIDIAILRSTDSTSTTSNEVVARVSPEQFKIEGESRLVAFYSSLHDCTNFVQPLGYGVIDTVELGTTTESRQTNTMGMIQQTKTKEVSVRTGRMSLPANLAEHQGTIALVVIPGFVLRSIEKVDY